MWPISKIDLRREPWCIVIFMAELILLIIIRGSETAKVDCPERVGRGTKATIHPSQLSKLSFGDWTQQGLPAYVGNMTYNCEFDHRGGPAVLDVPRFSAPLLSVQLNGQPHGKIAFQLHSRDLGEVPQGTHRLWITSFGNRENAFGLLHMPIGTTVFVGPQAWRTEGAAWYDEDAIQAMGDSAAAAG